jgi:hypothetical protein
LTIKNQREILAGWILTFNEVSNNVYKVTLTDKFGRQAETTDSDLEKAIITVETYAFEIQKQILKDWSKFLYNTCILKLDEKIIVRREYHEDIFGSWSILLTDKRIILDNRESIFCIQFFENGWEDIKTIKLSDLTFDNFTTALVLTQ